MKPTVGIICEYDPFQPRARASVCPDPQPSSAGAYRMPHERLFYPARYACAVPARFPSGGCSARRGGYCAGAALRLCRAGRGKLCTGRGEHPNPAWVCNASFFRVGNGRPYPAAKHRGAAGSADSGFYRSAAQSAGARHSLRRSAGRSRRSRTASVLLPSRHRQYPFGPKQQLSCFRSPTTFWASATCVRSGGCTARLHHCPCCGKVRTTRKPLLKTRIPRQPPCAKLGFLAISLPRRRLAGIRSRTFPPIDPTRWIPCCLVVCVPPPPGSCAPCPDCSEGLEKPATNRRAAGYHTRGIACVAENPPLCLHAP